MIDRSARLVVSVVRQEAEAGPPHKRGIEERSGSNHATVHTVSSRAGRGDHFGVLADGVWRERYA